MIVELPFLNVTVPVGACVPLFGDTEALSVRVVPDWIDPPHAAPVSDVEVFVPIATAMPPGLTPTVLVAPA